MSIRIKIAAITILAILTSILSVIGVSYVTVKNENTRDSAEVLYLLSVNAQKSLDEYLNSIEQSVEMTASIANEKLDSIVLVENGVAGSRAGQKVNTDALDTYLTEHCSQIEDIFNGIAVHTHGVVGYYYCIAPEISQSIHGFFLTKAGKTGFVRMKALDAASLEPSDMEHNAWYFTAVQSGLPSWTAPYRDIYQKEAWTISYVVPLYQAGSLIGVLGMDIPMDTLIEQIRNIRVYKTGFACLYDEDGKVIYHPRFDKGTDKPDFSSIPESGDYFHQTSSGTEPFRYEVFGEERQMAFSTLSNGMKLVVTAPVSEITSSWTQLTHIILMVTVFIVILFAVIVLFVMRLVTGPLQRLTSASEKLADGDYNVKLDYSGRDEVGRLTRVFKQMRDHLKNTISDLDRRANTDDLTGLPNMDRFFVLTNEGRQWMLRQGKKPVIVYFNLIGMKSFNRQYGFLEGNKLICSMAELISQHFGKENSSRFTQDQFAVLTDEERLEERIAAFFEGCADANGGKTLTVRAGIYRYSLEEVDVTIACDRAKYACDQLRGTFVSEYRYFDKDMLKRAETDRYVISNLDRALAEGWIRVLYQPIIRAANGRICDEEALSRWVDPVRGFLSPADFIPILESSKLIYKLDLYVLEQVLEKMKKQSEAGLYVVPQSVNLSRADFERCDIVEEIRRRVDAAGIERELLTIEITESIVGSDFDFIKEQVERFQAYGFPVWMDDFGSGYSSLDVLQSIHFDLIKFDMHFMKEFDKGDDGKIILTELVKMALGLGVETVCEGVEREEQVEFLREIGCTKIQGYYYCRPLPFEDILKRRDDGFRIGFENPRESDYFTAIGRINLYDAAVMAGEDSESLQHYFDTLPMAIIEVNGMRSKFVRCNRSYRDFTRNTFGEIDFEKEYDYTEMKEGPASAFMGAVLRCGSDGNRAMYDEPVNANTTIHSFIRRVAVNPVTGTAAVVIVVLAVIDQKDGSGTTYAHIARALSADYINLYYVDLETEQFIEYSSKPSQDNLVVERSGSDFFSASKKDARLFLHKDDQDFFIEAFTKEKILQSLDEHGTFSLTYRLLIAGEPTYVSMKAMHMQADPSHIIIGISNVDAQMRQKEALAKIQAEQATSSRIAALSGNYIVIYTIDPETEHYVEYNASQAYSGLGLAKQGENFFERSRKESIRALYRKDLERFNAMFTREKVLDEIKHNGMYVLNYRLMLNGEPQHVSARAVMIKDEDGEQLILGVSNIEAQVKREQEYKRQLFEARHRG